MLWVPTFAGWLFLMLGLMESNAPRALLGALLGAPLLLYLSLGEGFEYIAPLALLASFGVPVAIAYRRKRLGLACAVPGFGLALFVLLFLVR
jgi:hypothetical protein